MLSSRHLKAKGGRNKLDVPLRAATRQAGYQACRPQRLACSSEVGQLFFGSAGVSKPSKILHHAKCLECRAASRATLLAIEQPFARRTANSAGAEQCEPLSEPR